MQRKVVQGSMRKAFWKGSDKCWASMMLCQSSVRSKILLEHAFIKKRLSLILHSPTLLQTQGISISLLILACSVQNTPLCSASCSRSSTQQILCQELSCCHPNRTGRTSHSSCISHSSEPGVLHHVINQLCVQLSRCGHPGIRMLMEFLLVRGSFPFFFFLFSESIPEEITASEQTWHNPADMESRNWARCKTPPK